MKNKEQKVRSFDVLAHERKARRSKNRYYYSKLEELIASLVPRGKNVLEIGCGTGELLNAVAPSTGTGIDFSANMLELAKQQYPDLRFIREDAEDLQHRDTYDYVILSDLIGELGDVWKVFRELHKVTEDRSRIVITHYNYLWEPVLRLGERLGMKTPQDFQNWLSLADIEHVLYLNGYETITRGYRLLLPVYIPVLSDFINKCCALLPLVNKLGLVQYVVAKKSALCVHDAPLRFTVSVIVPCRNERGNIDQLVARVPAMGAGTELIFVDGASTDGTVEKIEAAIERYKGSKDIRLLHQTDGNAAVSQGRIRKETRADRMLSLGKGHAVRMGFEGARGDILMILDADQTVPPEDLMKFYDAIASGKGEFINGTRLVYQMEKQAMRTLNLLANKFFSRVFTWLLGQPIKDTLCGTKVLFRGDYENIKRDRGFFGDFDPFGDFDLLFGAAKQNLKIVEVPVRYRMRTYGNTKIERFKHGWLLLRMAFIGLKKFKLTG